MEGPDILRWNERMKAISSLSFNLGGALTAAVVVKVYNAPKLDLDVALWSAGMAFLLWLAYMLLGLLEQEEVM